MDLTENALTTLPFELQELHVALTNLYLGHNRLHEFPPTVRNLSHLKRLDISCNNLHRLSVNATDWQSLYSLEFLNMSGNELIDVPEGMSFVCLCFYVYVVFVFEVMFVCLLVLYLFIWFDGMFVCWFDRMFVGLFVFCS